MGITKDGIKGEQMLFKLLREKGYRFFQPDAIGLKNDQFFVFEAKNQERFEAPPFDGHGLPLWQVKARINFENKTNIVSVLVIFDKATNEIFYQSLRRLENGDHFDTRGAKPRRVYPIESFNKLEAEGEATDKA